MFVQIASIIVVSALALPQDTGSKSPPQGGKPQPGAQGGTQPGAPQGEKTRAEQARHDLMLQRSDKLIGMNIQDKDQGNVGVIDDMILTPNGQISYAVLSGTDAGSQGKLYTVPWNTLNMNLAPAAGKPGGAVAPANTGTERALINIDRERLMAGPSFDRMNWTKTSADREYFSQVDTYYGAGGARGDTTGRPVEAGANMGMNTIRSSQLRNQVIVDEQGKEIGNLSQVVFDPSGSRINYVAVTLVNPNRAGPRTIAVPWEALRVGRAAKDPSGPAAKTQFTLTTSTEKLTGAPEFQTGDASWKQMSDPKWVSDLYGYYSVRPYWSVNGMERNDPAAKNPPAGTPPSK